jgi:DNA-binding winged helix-turn-helix (wHTH) protein/tetratricopeptide (TPR) repeat protein
VRIFEEFRLDTTNHCLWRGEKRAALTPKAFDVLRYLVEHAGRLVMQEEILEALWPDTYVNPEGIRKYVLEIRKVLGDRPQQSRFIETVPKRGYRFLAKVTEERIFDEGVSPAPFTSTVTDNVVGREAEFGELAERLESARLGSREVVFVTGEAGIGKTTLADIFEKNALRSSGLRVARGQCIEGFGGKEAYYPMLEAIGGLIRGREGAFWAELLARRAPTWLVQFPVLVKADMRESLHREILGGTRERMVREFCELLEGASAETPLAVILEDLHWADAPTLDLISAVARRREPARLLLVATYRPVDVVLSQSPLKALKQDLLIRNLCNEITIERLEESDVAEYLSRGFVNHTFPSELVSLIHHNSGGNPLFMDAIVRDIVKKGLIVQSGGTWTLAAPLPEVYPGIPDTLQQLLEIQFEQLTQEERQILESCSVAGERFSVWTAAAITDMAAESIDETCERLAGRKQFIRFSGIHHSPDGIDTAHYEFIHSLYRQALYRRLSTSSRSRMHRRLGEALMPICESGKRELAAELAVHFEEAREHKRAARLWILAAENTTRLFSHRESIQILKRALELVRATPADTRVELEVETLQRIGDLHFALGDMSDSAANYSAAARLAAGAGLTSAQIGALVRLSFPAWYLDSARGNEVCRDVLAVSQSLEDPLLAAQTRMGVVSFRLFYDEWREQDAELCRAAQEAIERISGSPTVHEVFYIYVQAFQGKYQRALGYADDLMKRTTNPNVHVTASGAKGLIHLLQGRLGEALRIIREGRELSEKDGGDPWGFIIIEGWLRTWCFDYEGARRLGEFTSRTDQEQHAVQRRTVAMLATGYLNLIEKNFDEALQCFAQIREPRGAAVFFLHWYWRMRAELGATEVRLSAGHLVDARREADVFQKSAQSTAEPNLRALAWEVNARVAIAEKDFKSARQFVDHALTIVNGFDIPATAWRVHATAWELCRCEGHDSADVHRAHARESIMRLADSFDPSEPLRQIILRASAVQRLVGDSVSA